ncbi:MAG TPA: tRNA (adenosine(37)-N6)-threonylcarbamoyltransferase complex dimerization subunit type 1 TsaB [Capillimicrobium sp.]
MSGPLLSVDGSERPPSCALGDGDARAEAPVARGAVEGLPAAASALLGDRGLAPGDLAGVIVGAGPGSYMGARGAVTFANGLTYAAGVDVIVVSSLDAAAVLAAGDEDGPLTVALEAGRGRLYTRDYTRAGGRLEPAGEARLVAADELPAQALVRAPGDGAPSLALGGLALVARQPHLAQRLGPGQALPRVAVAGQRDSWTPKP